MQTVYTDDRDIAAVAARGLADDRWRGQTLDLSGPQTLTYAADHAATWR